MPAIYRHALMPYSAKQMFDIVNDVEQYPDFLPWCAHAEIISQTDTSMEASIRMQKGKLNHSFSTRNTMKEGEFIEIKLLKGPFKQLMGTWYFTNLNADSSKIELNMHFEFSSRLLAMLIGPVFTQIVNSLVDAFCRRAHQLYH